CGIGGGCAADHRFVPHGDPVHAAASEGRPLMSDQSLSSTPPRGNSARKRMLVDRSIDAFLVLFGLIMVLPLLMLVANAFKTPQELISWPPTLVPNNPTLDNITAVLNDTPLLLWMFNSFAFAA